MGRSGPDAEAQRGEGWRDHKMLVAYGRDLAPGGPVYAVIRDDDQAACYNDRAPEARPDIKIQPERELRWLGGLLMPGAFGGEPYFTIGPSGEG